MLSYSEAQGRRWAPFGGQWRNGVNMIRRVDRLGLIPRVVILAELLLRDTALQVVVIRFLEQTGTTFPEFTGLKNLMSITPTTRGIVEIGIFLGIK